MTRLALAGLVAFVARLCSTPFDVAPLGIDVVVRPGSRGPWSRAVVAPIAAGYTNDKPAAAIDSWPRSPYRGRSYVAWSITTDPSVTVGDGVFVTWTGPGRDGIDQDVFVRAFSRALAPLTRAIHVTEPGRARWGDQFLAASSFDTVDHRLWVCFYDTSGDPSRIRARYSCTASRDGISWPPASAVASVASNETLDDALDPGYGDYEGVVAVRGVAHPIWADGRDLHRRGEEIYTTTLTADRLSRR